MPKHIVMLSSLDTKAPEAAELKHCIEKQGACPIVLDIGYGRPPQMDADITADDVAVAAGTTIEQIRNMQDTGSASSRMTQGAIILVHELFRDGQCDGIIGFGGASNTTVATSVMKSLPVGVPKLMISSAAALPAYAASYFGSRDITMMHAVVDISGLNELTRPILCQGAAAVCAMAESGGRVVGPFQRGSMIAVTSFRFAEQCAQHVMHGLERLGYGAIPFHAQGVGENAMENLIGEGLFKAVVDIVPAGLSEQMLGGNRAARADRLEAAGRMGIPQVIAPGGFDMISCGPIARRDHRDLLWEERGIADRKYTVPDRFRVEARTTAGEVAEIGRAVGEKLNRAIGPVSVLVPTLGWSSLSVEGADLYDPAADSEFVPALKQMLKLGIPVREIRAELNSETFARELVMEVHAMIRSVAGDKEARN
jgi:uncharacterized protein (UPF0261 family)